VIAQNNAIEADQMALEFMMNGLRLKQGVAVDYFIQRSGLEPSSIQAQISNLRSQGLMVDRDDKYITTELGYRFLNRVLESF
jgi:oxygen-independent coproporphyrinogen-3 oxidase